MVYDRQFIFQTIFRNLLTMNLLKKALFTHNAIPKTVLFFSCHTAGFCL